MIIKEILGKSVQYLKDKGFETPRLDAELLLSSATGLPRIDLYARFEKPLEEAEVITMRSMLQRRVQGEPIAYILGEKEFYRHSFLVSPETLIPRPETELMVERILEQIKMKSEVTPLWILDLGVGTGCIAQSVLAEIPTAHAVGVEVNPKTLAVAQQNAARLAVADRYHCILGDAADPETLSKVGTYLGDQSPSGKFDIITANPPYVGVDDQIQKTVKDFEPHQALFSPDGGLFHLQTWSSLYAPLLAVGGLLVMEMGKDQGVSMKTHFETLPGFGEVRILKDYSGFDRFIEGVHIG